MSTDKGVGESLGRGKSSEDGRTSPRELRLRRHADYQRVYRASRKQFSRGMSYFFCLRPETGVDGKPLRGAVPGKPRIGLTVPKALGKAVDRNRIKRRMREAVRAEAAALQVGVDVILHPRRTAMTEPMPELRREVGQVLRAVAKMAGREKTAGEKTAGEKTGREKTRV